MATTHDVRIWTLYKYEGKRKTTHRARWVVGGEKFGESFDTFALADSFRSKLLTAAREGEAFDTESGLPVSMLRATEVKSWFAFACEYADMKWPESSPKYRASLAESLMTITVPMLKGKPPCDPKTLRKALKTAFNVNTRNAPQTDEVRQALSFAAKASRNVGELANADTLRTVLRALDLKLDGKKAATNTVRLRRVALGNAIEYAMSPEQKLLTANPVEDVKMKKRKFVVHEVDPKSVVNPIQGRMLLEAVGTIGKQGPPLVAFYGLMYYAALRPEEVANLNKADLSLPKEGWGDLLLRRARPEIGQEWTDSGEASEEGPLKHRAEEEERTVPCPPQLTALLHEHLRQFGTAPDGRLFRGARDGGRVGSSVYGRVWATARERVFTAEVAAGPLGKRPYDLRHAAVSTWLNGGVEPTRVAKWAGHSLSVLLRVYAKCLDGGEQAARDRVTRALGGE
ncbi:tyrosine-type recombinase/integrase [Amycolatopsis speibonae]|uniref:Tyrosine-type recombinase/integrase n=1 Tax=Amycolatopsis speibonae TaxID=1450224 RepID=A0ABV7NUJ0_9PSEU